MEEQTLISAAQRGDLEAFNELVLQYQDFLFRVAMNILGDEDIAADATQQAFLSAFRNLSAFRGGSLRSWLSRITVNASYDELRRVSRYKNVPLQTYDDNGDEMESLEWLADPNPSPEELAERSNLVSAIQNSLQALPEYYRLVVMFVDVDGLSYEEAAQALNIPVGTIRSRLARARNALRISLQCYADVLPATYILELPLTFNVC